MSPEINPWDLFFNWKLRVLLYSRSGYGKTYLAATAAYVKEMSPIWFYGVEKGFLSIKHIILGTRRIQPVVAKSAADLVALQQMLTQPGKYKTVVVDSLTELYAQLMAALLQKLGRSNEPPRRQDYRDVHDKVLKLCRFIEGRAEVHVIVTAGDMPTMDKEGQLVSLDPDIVGKLMLRIPRYFDVVGHLDADVERPTQPDTLPVIKRTMQVQPYARTTAKDRSPGGRLGALVSDPTMAKIYTALVGRPTMLPEGPTDDPSLQLDFPVPEYIKRELLTRKQAAAGGTTQSPTGESAIDDSLDEKVERSN